jgi:hypothetical protein
MAGCLAASLTFIQEMLVAFFQVVTKMSPDIVSVCWEKGGECQNVPSMRVTVQCLYPWLMKA